jgi:hypothetical protein
MKQGITFIMGIAKNGRVVTASEFKKLFILMSIGNKHYCLVEG